MSTKPPNPQAFPRPMFYEPRREEVVDFGDGGMSLRDHFAGQALLGLITHGNVEENWTEDEVARAAYNYADAMLLERTKENDTDN